MGSPVQLCCYSGHKRGDGAKVLSGSLSVGANRKLFGSRIGHLGGYPHLSGYAADDKNGGAYYFDNRVYGFCLEKGVANGKLTMQFPILILYLHGYFITIWLI